MEIISIWAFLVMDCHSSFKKITWHSVDSTESHRNQWKVSRMSVKKIEIY